MNKRLSDAYQRWETKQTAARVILGITGCKPGKRYMQQEIWPAVSWSKDQKGMAFAYHENRPCGMRHVGDVFPEFRANYYWLNSGDKSGWYTDIGGLTSRNGDGLVWGVVYQLPARRGRLRFVAGYQFGGCDGGPTLDFSEIFEEPRLANGEPAQNPWDYDASRRCARHADSMAQAAAEEEKQYQWEQREAEEAEQDEDEAA